MLNVFAAVLSIALAHHHHPPAEAVDACKAKQAGDACSFTHRDHAIDGTCFAPPDLPLACHPNHPPPEAIDACSGKAAGDACGFDLDGDHLTGACWAPPDRPLACRPEE